MNGFNSAKLNKDVNDKINKVLKERRKTNTLVLINKLNSFYNDEQIKLATDNNQKDIKTKFIDLDKYDDFKKLASDLKDVLIFDYDEKNKTLYYVKNQIVVIANHTFNF